MLTGLYPPTSGDAFVYGSSIRYEMDKVREILGICPQEDILFPTLTGSFVICHLLALRCALLNWRLSDSVRAFGAVRGPARQERQGGCESRDRRAAGRDRTVREEAHAQRGALGRTEAQTVRRNGKSITRCFRDNIDGNRR